MIRRHHLLVLFVLEGCRGDSTAAPSPTSSAPPAAPSASASAAPRLPALAADPIFEALGDDWISIPNGAREPRPLIVAIHGSEDKPEWNCDVWRHISGARGWVLCPRGDYTGTWQNEKFYRHQGGAALLQHIDAAIGALVAKYPGYVDVQKPVIAGFSLGAYEIVPFAAQDPSRFPRVAVWEGGGSAWTAARQKAFADGGGKRVMFVCGQPACLGEAKVLAAQLEKRGVGARTYYLRIGHAYDRPLQEIVKKDWSWFIEGDDRW